LTEVAPAIYDYCIGRLAEGETAVSENLKELIEMARRHQVTPEEREAQVRSFAYGNTHFENQTITEEDIDKAANSTQAIGDSE
jgi:hypothetical protein